MQDAGFFNFALHKIISKEQSYLNQARIRLLYYGLLLVFVASGALLLSVYSRGQFLLTYSAVFLVLSIIVLFKALTYKPNWRVISHALLIVGTLINTSVVYISVQTIS